MTPTPLSIQAGLVAIREHGGVGVVQDPEDAMFPGMPTSAVRYADPDHVVGRIPVQHVVPTDGHGRARYRLGRTSLRTGVHVCDTARRPWSCG